MGYSPTYLNTKFDYAAMTSKSSYSLDKFYYGSLPSYSSYSSYPSLYFGDSTASYGSWNSYKYSYSPSFSGFSDYSYSSWKSSYSGVPLFLSSYGTDSSYTSSLFSSSGGGFGSLTGYRQKSISFAPSTLSYTSDYKPTLSKGTSLGGGISRYAASGRITPQKMGRYSRPKKFTDAEAARLYDLFMSKAVKFDPAKDLGSDFLPRVKEIARNVKCDYRDLLAIMSSESGLNPYIPSQSGNKAYGFIQFLGGKNQWLRKNGYKPEDLLNMSPVRQLDLVEKFLLDNKKTFGFGNQQMSSGDMYALIFLPAMAKQEVVCYEGQYFKGKRVSWYESNRGLDLNGDKKITKTELAQQMARKQVNERIFAVA